MRGRRGPVRKAATVDDTRHARTQRLKPWLGRFDDEVATACTGLPPTGSARARTCPVSERGGAQRRARHVVLAVLRYAGALGERRPGLEGPLIETSAEPDASTGPSGQVAVATYYKKGKVDSARLTIRSPWRQGYVLTRRVPVGLEAPFGRCTFIWRRCLSNRPPGGRRAPGHRSASRGTRSRRRRTFPEKR